MYAILHDCIDNITYIPIYFLSTQQLHKYNTPFVSDCRDLSDSITCHQHASKYQAVPELVYVGASEAPLETNDAKNHWAADG
jgi:hypothetical protein